MNTTLDFKCPNCGYQMEEGTIATCESIKWIENKTKSSFLNILNFEELIPNCTMFKFQNNKTEALRCSNCQIVIFKY